MGFAAVLRAATNRAEMADSGRAKEHVFLGFLTLRQTIPSQDTDPTVLRRVDPKALDLAFGQVLALIAARRGDRDVIAILRRRALDLAPRHIQRLALDQA